MGEAGEKLKTEEKKYYSLDSRLTLRNTCTGVSSCLNFNCCYTRHSVSAATREAIYLRPTFPRTDFTPPSTRRVDDTAVMSADIEQAEAPHQTFDVRNVG